MWANRLTAELSLILGVNQVSAECQSIKNYLSFEVTALFFSVNNYFIEASIKLLDKSSQFLYQSTTRNLTA